MTTPTNLLADFFDSDELTDDAMYFLEMHGFLTALAVQPGSFSQQQIITEILADNKTSPAISTALIELQKDIEQALLKGDFPDITSAEEDEDSLTLWSSGFMQGVFSQEDVWFAEHPEEVAELTLPILSCSELLEEDLGDISQNDELLDDMADKIPDCVIGLYLLFNSPEGH
ncbi:MAG: YecA family protein [Cycloclasticus sp.]|nr:YecA family protein [Cycloclasticus sp.]